jgi:DNA-directed RNA polymerase specialized sigma24 family protein
VCEEPNAVKTAIRNMLFDMYRSNRRHKPGREDVELVPVVSEEGRIIASNELAFLVKVVPAEHLKALLRDAEGCKGPELALELGLSHAAARMRLHRARKLLENLPQPSSAAA